MNNSAMLYWEKNHFENAKSLFLNSLKINESLNNQNGTTMINSNLAMIYNDLKDYQTSIEYFNKTLLARRVSKEKVGIISALINQSIAYNNLSQFDNSLKNLHEALDLAREMSDTKQMKSCYGMLSETYEKSGDAKQALFYYNFFKTFNDLEVKNRIKKSDEKLKSATLEKEIIALEKRNNELELEKTQKQLAVSKDKVLSINAEQENLLKALTEQEKSFLIIEQDNQIKDLEKRVQNDKEEVESHVQDKGLVLLIETILQKKKGKMI